MYKQSIDQLFVWAQTFIKHQAMEESFADVAVQTARDYEIKLHTRDSPDTKTCRHYNDTIVPSIVL